MRLSVLPLTLILLCSLGCHSAFIEATVKNRTQHLLRLVEVDYPSASFGTQDLAPGKDFNYRFKVLGSGATKLLWTDEQYKEHTVAGPELKENDEGRMIITLNPDGPVWDKTLTNHGQPR